MRAGRDHVSSPMIETSLSPLNNGACRIDHVIEEQHAFPLHIPDDVHDLRLVRAFTSLVDDRQVRLKALGKRPGPLHTPCIG